MKHDNHPIVGVTQATAKFILEQLSYDDLRVLEQRSLKRGGLIGEEIVKAIASVLKEDRR